MKNSNNYSAINPSITIRPKPCSQVNSLYHNSYAIYIFSIVSYILHTFHCKPHNRHNHFRRIRCFKIQVSAKKTNVQNACPIWIIPP